MMKIFYGEMRRGTFFADTYVDNFQVILEFQLEARVGTEIRLEYSNTTTYPFE